MIDRLVALEQKEKLLRDTVESIKDDIEDIKKSDVQQESSLKSIHIRLNEDAEVRQETRDEVKEQTITLRTHMEWEEREHQLKKEAEQKEKEDAAIYQKQKDKKDSKRFTIIISILSVVATVFIAVSAWLFLTVISNDKRSTVLERDFLNIPIIVEKTMTEIAKEINAETIKASKKNYKALKYQINKSKQ